MTPQLSVKHAFLIGYVRERLSGWILLVTINRPHILPYEPKLYYYEDKLNVKMYASSSELTVFLMIQCVVLSHWDLRQVGQSTGQPPTMPHWR